MTSRRRVGAILAGLALLAPMVIGAAAAPTSRPAALCWSLIFTCPSPTPTPKASPTTPGLPGVPALPGATTPGAHPADPAAPAPAPSPSPVPATTDADAPVFTKIPASMGSQGLSFTGLRGIAIVNVPTIDGGTVRVLKISADSITITGFSLTVRPPDGPGLVTTADTMTLTGHVSVYLGSVTATTQDGRSLTLGTDTPPPLDDVSPGLLRVTMGLVGTIADSIHYTNTDQRIVQP
ncbi:hypothetical protein [Microbacterium capsulatum]|uniref:Uncharacterized protein n=1 Tax=Microbacterium capsulatum TaxID=3041921 RepID=A0ABU0XE36_9MICO|nr:hypothetical protein [Microbacterium sp. ASV81]MDQ4212974.1 hypothetical protein [Microbacterium sp. ASV81]